MKRKVALTDNNAPAASETDVSRLSKKPRLDDEQSSNQERQVIPFRPPQQDARLAAKHASLTLCVSRAVENAADALTEFCDNGADRQAVWCGIGNDAQCMLKRLVAAGRVGGLDRVIVAVGGDDRASVISATDQEQVVPFQPPQQDARLAAEHALLTLSVSRALENAAWTLDEFCDTDADRPAVWREMSNDAQNVIARLVAAGSVDDVDRAIVALRATSEQEEAEPDEDEEGWLSPKDVVDDAVAAARAAANAQCDGESTLLQAALAKCGEEGAPGSLEMIPKKDLTLKKIQEIIDIKDVSGASYTSLFARRERTSIVKAQVRVRPKLVELIKEATEDKRVALEKAEVDARLGLELAAIKALPDDEPEVTTLRSLLACGLMMNDASSDCLTVSWDHTSGTVDQLVNALRDSGFELEVWDDGNRLENTKDNIVLRVISSVKKALDALPPQEVIDAVLERTRLAQLAPRANKTACAALATTIRDAATGFAARNAKAAAKVTPKLPDFPTRDPATLTRRREEYEKWTGAPAADRAAVWNGVPFDSHQLGGTEPLREYPLLRGQPTIVSDPAATKTMEALAKSLVHGEKSHRGDAAAEESGEEKPG